MATGKRKGKKRKSKGAPDNPAQSGRFITAAKDLGLDTETRAFDEVLDAVLKARKPTRK